jgi:hypothetical protein
MARKTATTSHRIKTVGEAWTIVHAAATDHANRLMRAAGRKAWNVDDSDAHTTDLYRRLTAWGFWNGNRPTSLYFAMMADRSAPFVIPADAVSA